jgi:alpha-galactosidase
MNKQTIYQRTRGARLACLLLILCFLALQAAPCAQAQTVAQADLTGYWVFRVPNGDGTTRTTYFELKETGEKVTGNLLGRGLNGVPIAGTFKDGALHFETLPPAVPLAPTSSAYPFHPTVYEGTYSGGKLALHSQNFRREPLVGVAEKTTREATLPPARLPLPALRDIPDNGLTRTPPMGWNSWNKFAGKVDDAAVRSMADAIVSTGMDKLGYTYVNIDDTWEAEDRDAAGNIRTNRKFPDMKALADYVHSRGLKIGIYSSPGPKTCALYEGSYGHEVQDANTYAAWGIDYLKYDMCGARTIYKSTQEDLQPLYQKMGEALQNTHRPIVYSLCEYGDGDVWKWGTKVGGNLWRTTGDIRDEWSSMDRIGFSQIDIATYTRPGHWNDPDMLEIGNGGMNADEYRTHMSLWSMLSAPLMAGNDLRTMTDETKSILMNAEVIAIDQDPAAKPTKLLAQQGKVEILVRAMQDGSMAVGLYNRGGAPAESKLAWDSLGLSKVTKAWKARDLWKHADVPVTGPAYAATIPAHGVVLLRVSAGKQ